jgi:hypothetical protein
MDEMSFKLKLENDQAKTGTLILKNGTRLDAALFDIIGDEFVFILTNPKINGRIPLELAYELGLNGKRNHEILVSPIFAEHIKRFNINELRGFIVPIAFKTSE